MKLYKSGSITSQIKSLGRKYHRLFIKIGENLDKRINQYKELLKKLTDDDISVRGASVIELSKLRREDSKILRTTVAQDAFWRNVYHNLGSLSPEDAVKKWGEMSALALALTKDQEEQNQMLREIARSNQIDMKIHALKALGLNQDEMGLDILIESASNENSKVRATAIEALGMSNRDIIIPLLKNATNDSSITVTYAAINSLATLGTSQALAVLQEIIMNDHYSIRVDVIKAVVRAESNVDSDAAFELIGQVINGEQNNDVLYTATVALGQLKKPEGMYVLEKLSKHDSEHVRKGAKRAMEILNSIKK